MKTKKAIRIFRINFVEIKVVGREGISPGYNKLLAFSSNRPTSIVKMLLKRRIKLMLPLSYDIDYFEVRVPNNVLNK